MHIPFFSAALPHNCEFVVNFSHDLSEIISEARYLEKLGFLVPDLARNVALQEEMFLAYCDGLNHCLHRYHTLLASLQDAEVELLEDHIRSLQRVLKPGLKRLNWNSLGIQDYITKCEKVCSVYCTFMCVHSLSMHSSFSRQSITKFESLANQVQKNAGDIEERLHMFENVRLFKQPSPKPGCDLMETKVTCE